jgi:hypothetical protein
MPATPSNQRGVALLAFAVVLSIVAFTIVLGYSVSSAKSELASLERNQRTYLEDVRAKLSAAYLANTLTIDSDASWSAVPNGDAMLDLAGVTRRWGLQAAMTAPISRQGVKYRVVAAWLPLESDVVDDPVLGPDGTFTPCPGATPDCISRRSTPNLYVVVSDGLTFQRDNAKKAVQQLEQLAANAQSFFRTKTLLDPERNASVNYFRPPFGGCNALTEHLPCVDTFRPIAGLSNNSQPVTQLLGIPAQGVVNPWGLPVEMCNGSTACSYSQGASTYGVVWDRETQSPPYSMLFQTTNPWGSTYRIHAVQQL